MVEKNTKKQINTSTKAAITPGQKKTIGGKKVEECPVCLEPNVQPTPLPCKHTICIDCSKEVIQRGMTCPFCRAEFDKLFVPVIDSKLQAELALSDPEAF